MPVAIRNDCVVFCVVILLLFLWVLSYSTLLGAHDKNGEFAVSMYIRIHGTAATVSYRVKYTRTCNENQINCRQ